MDAQRTLSLLQRLSTLLSAQGAAMREMSEVLARIAEGTSATRLTLTRQAFSGRQLQRICEAKTGVAARNWRQVLPLKMPASSLRFSIEAEGSNGDGADLVEELNSPYTKAVLDLLLAEAEQRRVANLCMDLRAPTFESEDTLHSFADRVAAQLRDATDASYVAIRVDYGIHRFGQCSGFAAEEGSKVLKEELELPSSSQLLRMYDLAIPAKSISATPAGGVASIPSPRTFRGESDAILQEVRLRADDDRVASIVMFPFLIPNGRGVVTLSFRSHEYPTTRDLTDLVAIVSSAAASITTFLGFQQAMDARAQLIRDFQVFTNQELIQGYRHAAANAFEAMRVQTKRLSILSDRAGLSTAEPIFQQIRHADAELTRAFDGMRHLKVHDEVRFKKFDLDAPFLEARDSLRDKLADIECQVTKEGSASIRGDFNLLRVAFVNLFLNSLQSFEQSNKSQKVISLVINGAPGWVSGTISDTGIGFIPKANVRQVSDIWEVGRTTKEKGTGYGLPLVRFVFQDIQRGTIDVKDHRNGMTFSFRLPRDPTSR